MLSRLLRRPPGDPTVENYAGRAERFSKWAEEDENSAVASALRLRFLHHCAEGSGCSTSLQRACHGLKLLDVGCGSGRDLIAFAADGHEVVGVEPCEGFVQICSRRPPVPTADGPVHRPRVLHAGFEAVQNTGVFRGQLPESFSGGVDGIFCLASLFHVPRARLPALLRSMRALMRPGGVLCSTMPCDSTTDGRGKDGRWVTALPLDAHVALLEAAGFEVVEADDQLRIYNGKWGTCFARRPRDAAAGAVPGRGGGGGDLASAMGGCSITGAPAPPTAAGSRAHR